MREDRNYTPAEHAEIARLFKAMFNHETRLKRHIKKMSDVAVIDWYADFSKGDYDIARRFLGCSDWRSGPCIHLVEVELKYALISRGLREAAAKKLKTVRREWKAEMTEVVS